jgi:hypothetical protein
LIPTINKRLFTMKVENHDTTKLGNQDENLLKREIQRMWTNIKLCLTTYVHVYYSFLIQQLLYYVCYAYLLITKLLKIVIFAHGEHKKKLIRMYSILFYIRIQLVTGATDADMIVTLSLSYFNVLTWSH